MSNARSLDSNRLPPPRALVVCYSRTGNTESIARGLARALSADLEMIEDVVSRKGILGYLRSGYDATYRRSAVIRPSRYDPSNYDLVLIGSPTWNSALPGPVRAYLTRFSGRLPEIGLFVTYGGRGADAVVAEMTALASKKPLASLTLTEAELKGRFSVYVAEFLETVLEKWASCSTARRVASAGC